MKKTVYIIHYKYYQYNSGQADNGTYWAKQEFEDKEKAQQLYQLIRNSIDDKLSQEEDQELIYQYIPNGGYFKEVKCVKSIVEEHDFDSEEIENRNFIHCPYCYSEKEGDSDGCSKCSNIGEREVNECSIDLALSAQQWLNNQVENVWKSYSKVFMINSHFLSWSLSDDKQNIIAIYYSETEQKEKNVQLKKKWLWSEKIEEILIHTKQVEEHIEKIKEIQQKIESLE